tara:strand:+ start:750 stop:953 length:204 start_codon:yes stop_codon:yes gene_type:complete
MIQTLKKYRFWIFLTLAALILFVDLMLGVEARPLIDGLGFIFFMLACMSVPDSFGKKAKQPVYGYEK